MCCKNVSICYTNQMLCSGLWGHWYKHEDKYTAEFPILSYNQAARTHTSQQMSHTKLLSPRYLILWNKDLVADNKMQMYITFWRWHLLTWHNGKFIKPIVYAIFCILHHQLHQLLLVQLWLFSIRAQFHLTR